jgi:hypothetical protein
MWLDHTGRYRARPQAKRARHGYLCAMMMPFRRNSPAAQRFADRRRREDDAPKLCLQVPALASLRLEFDERSSVGGVKHTRRFVIDHAPALFLVPCGDPRCADGEHDLTTMVMRALRARETSFQGSDECLGSVGMGAACPRVLHFDGKAEYHA